MSAAENLVLPDTIPPAPSQLRLVPPATSAEDIITTSDELWQLAQFRGVLDDVVQRAGSSRLDAVQAFLAGAFAAQAELPKLHARIAEYEAAERVHKLEALFGVAEREHKLTPAIRAKVQAALDEGEITLNGAARWIDSLVPIAAFASKAQPGPMSGPSKMTAHGPRLAWNGRSWSELNGLDRKQLLDDDRELYMQMRAEAQERGY